MRPSRWIGIAAGSAGAALVARGAGEVLVVSGNAAAHYVVRLEPLEER